MFARIWEYIVRNRVSISELVLIAAVVGVVGFLAFELDFFMTEVSLTAAQKTLDVDEVMILGALLTTGLLLFGWHRMLAFQREVEKRKASEGAYRTLASEDALTGLPNRRQFTEALDVALRSPPGADVSHALIYIDLNGFKMINDVYGHNVGDETLIIVAQRLRAAMRGDAMVARLGGDEFAILATQLSGPEAATNIARRVVEALRTPVVVGGIEHPVQTGLGICMFPFEGATNEEVLRRADVALYKAKGDHSSVPHFFDADMDRTVHERESMARELRLAVARGEISPYFQPLIDLRTKQIIGFEALPRWTHSTFGEISPERFLPIAEESGLIGELTDQLFFKACTAAVQWPAEVILAFNISPSQLRDAGLGLRIVRILGETGLLPHRLEIEITESALVKELDNAQRVLGGLREIGVRIALDDFGTGYSSLYHLRNFKVDKIKIDRSFISTMDTERESEAIVDALAGLGKGLGLTVMADGIEGSQQEAVLEGKGIQQGQGYLLGQALPAKETAALFRTERTMAIEPPIR